ncbi:MAG: hypothetical protein HYU39_04695 [Thaumarchaeota archaeon]|nr:hypothetical protein [Nitrososphaerota archaeon]
MSDTTVITVKIPRGLKRKMKKVDVNWSEYIRGSIKKKIEEQELKDASARLDKIRAKAKPVPTDELVSWIREDRSR